MLLCVPSSLRLRCSTLLLDSYFFSFAYGFSFLCFTVTFLFILHAMIAVVMRAETKALHDGSVSFDQPRALFVQFDAPAMSSTLPGIWSLFHPLNAYVDNKHRFGSSV